LYWSLRRANGTKRLQDSAKWLPITASQPPLTFRRNLMAQIERTPQYLPTRVVRPAACSAGSSRHRTSPAATGIPISCYHAEACRRGAGAIPLLSAKMLDTALVPRALGRRLPPIWPLFQRSQSSAFSFSVTHVRACPSKCIPFHLPIRRHGCCVDQLNPPGQSRHPATGRKTTLLAHRVISRPSNIALRKAHSITSSALPSNCRGNDKPRAFAVLRFSTNRFLPSLLPASRLSSGRSLHCTDPQGSEAGTSGSR
jgi:hypothetical protein